MENCTEGTKTCLFKQTFEDKPLMFALLDNERLGLIASELEGRFPKELQYDLVPLIKIYRAVLQRKSRYVVIGESLAQLIRESEWMKSIGSLHITEDEEGWIGCYFHVSTQSTEQPVSS